MIRNQLVDLIDLIEIHLDVKKFFIWPAMKNVLFFASEEHKKYDLWTCQKVIDLSSGQFILDLVLSFIDKTQEFQWELLCPLVADLVLFCYERDFMKSHTKEKRYDLIDAFTSTSRYIDVLLNIDNIHFEHMVHRIYSAELELNKANVSDTEAAFFDLNLSIHNDIVSTKYMINGMIFYFDIVNFPFLIPMSLDAPLIRFARASSHVTDINAHNKFLTFSKFYHRHFEMIENYHVSLKNLFNNVFVIQNSRFGV